VEYSDETLKDNNSAFLTNLYSRFQEVEDEVSQRNELIADRDQYVYSDKLEKSLDIPVGHDFTPVNWLKRTVEIHKTQFMGRPFQMISSYDTQDLSVAADETDRGRKELENKKEKAYAEERRNLIDKIVRENGGHALFSDGAESGSAVGSWIVKTWYDEKEDKFNISPIEAVENCYVVWSKDDFRQYDMFGFVQQISKAKAAKDYNLKEDELNTSPLGSPFVSAGSSPGTQYGSNNSTLGASSNTSGQTTGQPMVTVLEATGILQGWCVKNGKLYPCKIGDEIPVNVTFVGGKLVKLISDEKKLPKYYIFPNKKIRRRAWGISDITDAAIMLNLTYIETLSDWRTIASKVNFAKIKGFNFGPDSQTPKFAQRKIQLIPLTEGQDMQVLPLGDANGIDWGRQLDEIKEQFVRETGISRVLFDDPSVTLNSNQALLTSMKPTSDIAENKKQLWGPILVQMFTDALATIAAYKKEVRELVDGEWSLKVQWPSVMQKEDPVYQQMLLNRWNAGTLSMQSYLEMQGETKEEIDRIRDEFADPVTAAALGHSFAPLAQFVLGLPSSQAEMGAPQAPSPVATPAQNTPGAGPASQPGSGATPVAPQGALNQVTQQAGA
jgi:hypothetical protein